MRWLSVVVALAALSGCITERQVAFSAPGPSVRLGEHLPAVRRSWSLGEVFVKAEHQSAAQTPYDWAPARRKIEQHITDTLRARGLVGRRVEDRASADFIVDVEVHLKEQRGNNGWLVPAIITSATLLVGGAVLGGYLGGRSFGDGGRWLGFIGGEFAMFLPAAGLTLLMPVHTLTGTADATLTFRRGSDGVAVLEKKSRAEWSRDLNGYFLEERMGNSLGDGIAALEENLVVALHEGLSAAPPKALTSVDPAPVQLSLTDAPVHPRLFPR